MSQTGVHKRWSQKFLLKELACRVSEYANLTPERRAEELESDGRYESKVAGYADGNSELDFGDAVFALEHTSRQRLRLAAHDVYATTPPELSAFDSATHHWVQQRLLYLGRNIAVLGQSKVWGTSLRDLSETLSMAYSLGWNNAADRIGAWTLQLLPLGMCWSKDDWDPRWEKRREPFARFAMALYADFADAALPDMPSHPYEAPAYDALLSIWRNPDPAVLVEPLLAACDWHTHECMYSRSDKPSKNVDFINDTLMGWPVEVHMVYRLRERLGLALPDALDHPLMQTPFGPYRAPQPIPHDELLHRFVKRACIDVPGLRALLDGAVA